MLLLLSCPLAGAVAASLRNVQTGCKLELPVPERTFMGHCWSSLNSFTFVSVSVFAALLTLLLSLLVAPLRMVVAYHAAEEPQRGST